MKGHWNKQIKGPVEFYVLLSTALQLCEELSKENEIFVVQPNSMDACLEPSSNEFHGNDSQASVHRIAA